LCFRTCGSCRVLEGDEIAKGTVGACAARILRFSDRLDEHFSLSARTSPTLKSSDRLDEHFSLSARTSLTSRDCLVTSPTIAVSDASLPSPTLTDCLVTSPASRSTHQWVAHSQSSSFSTVGSSSLTPCAKPLPMRMWRPLASVPAPSTRLTAVDLKSPS
jgi:hypothetical protein